MGRIKEDEVMASYGEQKGGMGPAKAFVIAQHGPSTQMRSELPAAEESVSELGRGRIRSL